MINPLFNALLLNLLVVSNRTVLREMIQNAADASATKVTIRFETFPSTTVPLPSDADQSTLMRHVVSHHTVRRVVISNNGVPFSEKDWARLKRIADGNPDETKIGAFGVGFYSVFDDCEEPFVSSGGQAMAFYWKGNALFTRRLRLEDNSNLETSFVLDQRSDTSPVPSLMQLCQFLSTSLTFVGLQSIDLWLDDWNLLRLTKKTAPSEALAIPRDVQTKTSQGLMKISHVTREIAQIEASWMRIVEWHPQVSSFSLEQLKETTGSLRTFFSRLTGQRDPDKPKSGKDEKPVRTDDMDTILTACVSLHINTASIEASVSRSLSSELERATRKPPPKRTKIAVLMPSYDANVAAKSKSEILSSILPSKTGKIFIGFPTQQTTGLNAHISAPSVIPTVERESIDLNTRYISTWNLEMLRAAGVVCRIAWSAEMAAIKGKIQARRGPGKSSKIRMDDIKDLLPEAVHTANQFTFRESTPSTLLGQTIEDAFWMCNREASIELLSTCGVIPSQQVRIAPKELSFMETIPAVPGIFEVEASDFVKKLAEFGLLTEITVTDIKRELEASTLYSSQVTEFLTWLAKKSLSGELDEPAVQSLLRAAAANDSDPEDANVLSNRLLVLADMSYFLNPQRIPADLPVPPFVMPFKYTKTLGKKELEALGWRELGIPPWVRWIVENAANRTVLPPEKDITQSQSFSAQVLQVVSKQWESLSQSSKSKVVELLRPRSVIPTRLGMKRPAETYFPSVRLFDDLPVVYGVTGVKDKFLAALGVRKTVELNVIFERLLSTTDGGSKKGQVRWSHVDLIRYLTSVRDDIPKSEIAKLKNAEICTAETEDDALPAKGKLYKISELFEPRAQIRDLGFPVIEWPGNYQPSSNEGKFLTTLGLRRYPSAEELVRVMADSAPGNRRLHARAMAYYISQYYINGYAIFNCSLVGIPFLPVEASADVTIPAKCFTDEGAALFGFKILRHDLHPNAAKLGVKQHPPLSDCLDILIQRPPTTKKDAGVLFKYLARRVADLSQSDVTRAGSSSIVPVQTRSPTGKPITRLVPPKQCYLGESEDYGDIFDFVDFGPDSNLFLVAVGSKTEPTKVELAYTLVKEPARIASVLQSTEKYLKLLRTLAGNVTTLRRDRQLFLEMKKAPFLLASRDVPINGVKLDGKEKQETGAEEDDSFEEDEQSMKEWTLAAAPDVAVVDDFQSFNLFREHILVAPQEELLENFYATLGVSQLSSIVEKQPQWAHASSNQQAAVKLKKLISERSRLFLYDQPPDSIQHDNRWLDKNLDVQLVHSISLKRSLKGRRISNTQKRSAIITQQQRSLVLLICPGKYDFYQISQALVNVILNRPKLHSTLTLEMLLKTDLLELKARGYNVQRILKQKAQEAKVAEEIRQKQVEEERQQLREQEAEWARTRAKQDEEQGKMGLMPGDFPDDTHTIPANTENTSHGLQNPRGQRPRGLFANLTKRLGLDSADEQSSSPAPVADSGKSSRPPSYHRSTGANLPPPPYSTHEPGIASPGPTAGVNPPHMLQSELLSAVQACRPHGSSDIYSRPQVNQLAEARTYCDERPGQDLEFAASLPSGMSVLVAKSIRDRSSFLTENRAGLNLFTSVLLECAASFNMRSNVLSIYYDAGGKTIAFNRAGSIFCNYLYFKELHLQGLIGTPHIPSIKTEAIVYWWVIICHELAHNLVEDHNSAHSYYRYVTILSRLYYLSVVLTFLFFPL